MVDLNDILMQKANSVEDKRRYEKFANLFSLFSFDEISSQRCPPENIGAKVIGAMI